MFYYVFTGNKIFISKKFCSWKKWKQHPTNK